MHPQARPREVEACEARRRMWESTADRTASPLPLRSEARARANEAAWLADALRSRA